MLKRICLVLCTMIAGIVAPGVRAQEEDVVFVQIEARRSLSQATESARGYASELADVNGFSLGGGWYGVALGPYTRVDANQVLRVYRSNRQIPSDSFIALPARFGQQFWPVGANVLGRGVVDSPVPEAAEPAVDPQTNAPDTPVAVAPDPEPAPEPEPEPEPDETPREAQRGERLLSPQERRDIQIALKWAGFYRSGIDGAFGRGTRNAMAAWQLENGFSQTGILTTRQRAVLIAQYNAVLDGLGLELVTDVEAGVEIKIPTGVVEFGRYVAPFAHYDSSGDLDARVLLVSQAGDQSTLFGLYEILQTLEVVPLDGPRERRNSSFTITGENDRIVSETRVFLADGEIKGFILVWPAGDEERRTRLFAEMEKSFRAMPGALPLDRGLDDVQSVDLVSGLEVRKPRVSRSGFFVDPQGIVVTTSMGVMECSRITLDGETEAELLLADDTNGIAVLRPKETLAPQAIARFSDRAPRLQSQVAVAGYSFEGVLGAASMTFGTLSDLKGLGGEAELKRLALNALPGDAGGPVFDAGGGVLGMLLPRAEGGRQLPEEVNFATDGDAIQAVLEQAGLAAALTDSSAPIDPVDLTNAAQGMTVLVSCWD